MMLRCPTMYRRQGLGIGLLLLVALLLALPTPVHPAPPAPSTLPKNCPAPASGQNDPLRQAEEGHPECRHGNDR